jgi:hypothetical protein
VRGIAAKPVVFSGIDRLRRQLGDKNGLVVAAEAKGAGRAVGAGSGSVKCRQRWDALTIQLQVAVDRVEPFQLKRLDGYFDAEASRLICQPQSARLVAGCPPYGERLANPTRSATQRHVLLHRQTGGAAVARIRSKIESRIVRFDCRSERFRNWQACLAAHDLDRRQRPGYPPASYASMPLIRPPTRYDRHSSCLPSGIVQLYSTPDPKRRR